MNSFKHGTLGKSCVKSQLTSSPYPKSNYKATRILEFIYRDECVPIQTASTGGKTDFLTSINDYPRFIIICLIEKK